MSFKNALLMGLILVLALAAVARVRHEHELRDLLLHADPDAIASNPRLVAYAQPLGATGYNRYCASCHGDALRGEAARGIPNLVDRDWLYGSGRVAEIERVVLYGIRSGHPKSLNLAAMPAFATPNPYPRYKVEPLAPREIEDVAAMVYAAQHRAAVNSSSIARGTAIFLGKGMCFDCHAQSGGGDPAIGAPDLTDEVWLYGSGSLEDIKDAIEHGLNGACPSFAARLAPEQARAIAVYVHMAGV